VDDLVVVVVSALCILIALLGRAFTAVLILQVKSIDEMGAYVKLLEYNNVEGMILMTELSRRRIRSINKLLRVGKQEVVMVLRVDRERGALFLPSLFFPLTAYEKIKSTNRVYRSVKKGCVGRRCSVDGGALQQSKGGALSRRVRWPKTY
jgi:hypothetical protein